MDSLSTTIRDRLYEVYYIAMKQGAPKVKISKHDEKVSGQRSG